MKIRIHYYDNIKHTTGSHVEVVPKYIEHGGESAIDNWVNTKTHGSKGSRTVTNWKAI